ncbi:MAG: hypothetical protein EP346_09500 [Bacteroidetes bacterium]|uniref:DUF5777 domain-containing protein n=1 Tax=Phaeocystidibacter marisrubri TaxID=1577780 RepID=A0A6L3ZHV8_9FLAO|nr:DUF5777 family beta-barrel protein [Phaeocystidibacter marisrubri]KAB2817209.1 hypothetical protein F8C82_02120 [Phaeocystidibacter marisrubri]TNE28368.1 MAG: hypothetical protein EP346_09500 [Bacteroidota bacterium]GGH76414.1 hypothetical protein GCM10011318_24640 [Phaeocystidibacter marisrubri]
MSLRRLITVKSVQRTLFFIFGTALSISSLGQDDMFDMLGEEEEPTVYTTATFKGSRVINLQSTEMPSAGVGQFIILHRFGAINDEPLYNFFGLDVASVRLSFDYSINDYINFGLGRSSGTKVYDGWVKAKLLRQSSGARNMPISLLYYGSVNVNTSKFNDDYDHYFSERVSYVNQVIVGKKFNESFSMELVPTVVHFNVRDTREQPNTLFGLGAGGRLKLTNRVAITADYMLQLPQKNTRLVNGVETAYNNSFSIGVDIETGGHVFQLHLTNSRAISDPNWMMNTPGNWFDGDIFFGFNISRVFTLRRPEQPEAPTF